MTSDERLTVLKAMVGDTDSDDVLSAYLSIAGSKILARVYPYNPEATEIPSQYDYLQVELAAFMLNKRGAEGQVAHNENSVNRTWENGDVPASMLKMITPFCGVIG